MYNWIMNNKNYILIIVFVVVLVSSITAYRFISKTEDKDPSATQVINNKEPKDKLNIQKNNEKVLKEFQLSNNIIKVGYKYEDQVNLEVAYNNELQDISRPIDILLKNYPQYSDAKFYYQGDVVNTVDLKIDTTKDFSGWHVVSAVRPVIKIDNQNLENEPETITFLLSKDQLSMAVVDLSSFTGNTDDEYQLKKPLIHADQYSETTIWNLFHMDGEGIGVWKNTYFDEYLSANATGAGGTLRVLSDTKKEYEIEYYAAPFKDIFKDQEQIDTIMGRPIYKFEKGKYFTRAENGFIYQLSDYANDEF